jgi:hypothetical protein
MTNFQITESEIEDRVRSIAYAEARAQLEKEKQIAAVQEAAARQKQLQQIERAADEARKQLNALQSGYQRRAELLAQLAPVLDELMQLDSSLKVAAQSFCDPMVGHWRSVGRDPRQEVPALRTAAGLPLWHDSIGRAGDEPGKRIAQLIGQLIAQGAMATTRGSVAAPDGSIVLTVGTESLIVK